MGAKQQKWGGVQMKGKRRIWRNIPRHNMQKPFWLIEKALWSWLTVALMKDPHCFPAAKQSSEPSTVFISSRLASLQEWEAGTIFARQYRAISEPIHSHLLEAGQLFVSMTSCCQHLLDCQLWRWIKTRFKLVLWTRNIWFHKKSWNQLQQADL